MGVEEMEVCGGGVVGCVCACVWVEMWVWKRKGRVWKVFTVGRGWNELLRRGWVETNE